MTRMGMKEAEMKEIATFFKQCLIDGKFVGDEVVAFRNDYQSVHYSYDAQQKGGEREKGLQEGPVSVTA
jgi:glycine/serine hydroxymethyltransferase